MKTYFSLELTGLNGGNPLAFLAALGVLRALALAHPQQEPKLSWSSSLRPCIHTRQVLPPTAFIDLLIAALRGIVDDGITSFGDIIGVAANDYDRFVSQAIREAELKANVTRLLFASAYGTSAVTDPKKGTIVPNALSFSNRQGGKLLLKDFRTLVNHLNAERLKAALFQDWIYEDQGEPTFRWDPQEMRTGAHMATDPGTTPMRSVVGANALGFVGMSFLTAVPMGGDLVTIGFRRIDGDTCFAWPLWMPPLNVDVISSLLQQKTWELSQGVFASFASQRIMFQKNLYLGSSIALDLAQDKE